MEEKIEQIRERILLYPALKMSRVPEKTLAEFTKLAKDEFCDDRGLTLKFLVDFYFGLIPKGTEHLEIEIAGIKQELAELKARMDSDEQESHEVKTLGGKTIRKGGE